MDYKDTLNLPKTDFPMKANLPKKEVEILAGWDKIDLYQCIREARAGAATFILHDGPPYANGNIHSGTALNKILKDIVVKIKTMSGLDTPYVPGWDCHGLPIEHQVDKKLGKKKRDLSVSEIRKTVPRIRRKVYRYPTRGIHAPWCHWRLEQSIPDISA